MPDVHGTAMFTDIQLNWQRFDVIYLLSIDPFIFASLTTIYNTKVVNIINEERASGVGWRVITEVLASLRLLFLCFNSINRPYACVQHAALMTSKLTELSSLVLI